jgi:hypothetical protein
MQIIENTLLFSLNQNKSVSHLLSSPPCLSSDSRQTRQNQIVWFAKPEVPVFPVQVGSPSPCSIHVLTHFGDSTGESTTSHPSSMMKGGSGLNGSEKPSDQYLDLIVMSN